MEFLHSKTLSFFLIAVINLSLVSCSSKMVEIKEQEKIARELEYKFINSVHDTEICLIFDKSLLNEDIRLTQDRDKLVVMEKKMYESDFERGYTYLFLRRNSFGSILYVGKSHYFIPSDIYQESRFIEVFKKAGSKKIFLKFSNKNKYNIELNVFPGAPKYSDDLEW